MVLFVLMSGILMMYNPSATDTYHKHYVQILTVSPRLFIASIVAFTATQYLDRRLYIFFRKSIAKHSIPLGITLSLSLSQIIDTSIFTVVGLLGIVNSALHVAVFSIVIKFIGVFVIAPFTLFTKKLGVENAII